MKVTNKNSYISCFEGFSNFGEVPYAHIYMVGYKMRAEERQNITVLDFPKFVRENGKDYLVKDLFETDLEEKFPKLKKVRIPNGAAVWSFLDSLKKHSIEVEMY